MDPDNNQKYVKIKIATIVVALLILAVGLFGWWLGRSDNTENSNDTRAPTADTSQPEPAGATLDLSGQQLTTLSEDVLSRTDVRVLNLSNNQLTTLPAGIARMTSLEVLNVENNRLESLPQELETMTWLKELDVSNNRLPVDVQEQLKSKLPNTQVKT